MARRVREARMVLTMKKPVGLVACCKSKLVVRAKARVLYTGNLFRLSLAWLEPRCEGLGILSAKHGLLLPDQEVDPYEQTLVGAPEADKAAWAAKVRAQLEAAFPGAGFLAVCGKDYLGALDGLPHEVAFGGLRLGEKLSALKKALAEDRAGG